MKLCWKFRKSFFWFFWCYPDKSIKYFENPVRIFNLKNWHPDWHKNEQNNIHNEILLMKKMENNIFKNRRKKLGSNPKLLKWFHFNLPLLFLKFFILIISKKFSHFILFYFFLNKNLPFIISHTINNSRSL